MVFHFLIYLGGSRRRKELTNKKNASPFVIDFREFFKSRILVTEFGELGRAEGEKRRFVRRAFFALSPNSLPRPGK
jgi:hypothetical protein